MTDRGKLAKQRADGSAAEQLLKNQGFVDACEKIEKTIIAGWRSTEGAERDERERAYLLLRLLSNLRTQIARTAATGRVAAKELLKT